MRSLVFISSVINTLNEPLTYTKTRSVFSADERMEQTLKSIQSVRKHIPNAAILLVESSILTDEQTKKLQENVDYYLNLESDPLVKEICLKSPKKGFGEAIQTLFAARFIQEKNIQFDIFYKLSGRYSLTDKFTPEKYSSTEYTFYKRASSIPLVISTVVYSVPFILFQNFYSVIASVVETYFHVNAAAFEELFPARCSPRIEIDEIGVEGLVSVNGDYFSC